MSLFGQVFEKRSLTDVSGFWYGLGGTRSSSGVSVSSKKAMRHWPVFACVTLISNAMGGFPLSLKKKLPSGGSKDATDHPLYHLMKLQPNKSWNSNQLREFGQRSQLLSGNQYSWIERSRVGVKAIWPLDPNSVTVKWNKATREREYSAPDSRGTGKVNVKQRDILHIPGYGFDGTMGYSFITCYARDVIGRGLSQGNFASKYFKNGIFTSGTFEHPNSLGDNKDGFISAIKAKWAGENNTGVPMVLENGMKFEPMKLSLVDQQFIEQEKLNAEHICGMLQVPLHKISIPGAHNAFNNTEQMNRHFLDTTLMPWVVSNEQCYNTQLLTRKELEDGYFFKSNFGHFLRPDAKTRAEIGQIRFSQGIPINRYLSLEDEEPVPWGDKGFIPLNYVNVESDEANGAGDETDERFARSAIERRSAIDVIDRIMVKFAPKIRVSAQKVVKREAVAIKEEAGKQLSERSESDFSKWLDEFYSNINVIISRDLGPTISSYWDESAIVYIESIGESVLPDELEAIKRDYINGISRQWVNSSRGQIIALMAEEGNNYEAIMERAEEWTAKRSYKVEEQQKRAVPNAVSYFLLGAFGYSLRWNNRGKTCSYCRTLNGKLITRGQNFVSHGDEISPGGDKKPMLIKGNTKYPPLHRGCDCYLGASNGR